MAESRTQTRSVQKHAEAQKKWKKQQQQRARSFDICVLLTCFPIHQSIFIKWHERFIIARSSLLLFYPFVCFVFVRTLMCFEAPFNPFKMYLSDKVVLGFSLWWLRISAPQHNIEQQQLNSHSECFELISFFVLNELAIVYLLSILFLYIYSILSYIWICCVSALTQSAKSLHFILEYTAFRQQRQMFCRFVFACAHNKKDRLSIGWVNKYWFARSHE